MQSTAKTEINLRMQSTPTDQSLGRINLFTHLLAVARDLQSSSIRLHGEDKDKSLAFVVHASVFPLGIQHHSSARAIERVTAARLLDVQSDNAIADLGIFAVFVRFGLGGRRPRALLG